MKTAYSAGTAAVTAGMLGLLLLASPATGETGDTAGKLLPAGQAAPIFEAVDIDGKPFSLKEELTRGPVFLVFWSIF